MDESQHNECGIDEDALLMSAVSDGNDAAFTKLVLKYQKKMLNFFARSGVYSDAEDLVQQTFVRLYRYRDRYSPEAKFTTFLYLIARQVRVDEIRRRVRLQRIRELVRRESEIERSPSRGSVANLFTDDLQAALAKLTDAHREVVVLGLLQDLQYSEVSEILGIPEGTVKSRMHHALKRLRELFEKK